MKVMIKKYSFLTGLFLSALILSDEIIYAQTGQNRADWMKLAKFGVMTHYLSDWKAKEYNEEMNVEKWNSMIDNFDVEGFADQIKSVGASYLILTIGQNSGYYLSPNKVYDKYVGIVPSHCSRRDLIVEVADALNRRGIKLIAYLPAGAPAGDKTAREALQWTNGPDRNKEFQIKWEEVIREWSKRWGDKISGWWFDGCYWPNQSYRTEEEPNFKSFAEAARSGNHSNAVAFNPGVIYRTISVTPYEDYIAGEIDFPEKLTIKRAVDGKVDGVQIQILSFLGEKWGIGSPRFTSEQIIAWSSRIVKEGGAITWDVPVQKSGLISQPFFDQLKEVGKALGKIK